MELISITYQGRTVAAATATRFFLADELISRPPGDPETVFCCYLCAFAREVLRGELPGPYTETRARQFARAALIPQELLERDPDQINIRHAAQLLRMPEHELRTALTEAVTQRSVPTY
jgi:hypothetical protein